MWQWSHKVGLTALIGWMLISVTPLAANTAVTAQTPLGTVTTATIQIDNRGKPAATALLYEAWPTPPARQRAVAPLRVPVPDLDQRLDPQLLDSFTTPTSTSEMIVFLNDQADLSYAPTISDWRERGAWVYATLSDHARDTQAPLLNRLRRAGYTPRSLWIVNAVAVRGDRALAEQLAADPAVAVVAADHQHTLDVEPSVQGDVDAAEPAWGVQQINAPQVWSTWGVRGNDIVVANIDSGVAYSHTALLHAYRGWSPTGINHEYNWFDATTVAPSSTPIDPLGHGTHTMGTMVGRATDTFPAIGVAPRARWIAARGCVSIICNDSDLITAAQWLLAPTDSHGANPRPDLRPHIINNSWGEQSERSWYTGYVHAWNAAGILSVFASGNSGMTGCSTSYSPGNYAPAFAVGATDANDDIASFSSRGPTADGRVKPEIVAPGVDIVSAWPDGSLHLSSGTSMAAPHVAGVAALVWSANPTLIGDLDATHALLTGSSLPLYSSECHDDARARPNNVYGWGRVDAWAATLDARVDVPWLEVPIAVNLPANSVQSVNVTLDARQVTQPGQYAARVLIARNGVIEEIPIALTVDASGNTQLVHGRLRDIYTGQGVWGRIKLVSGPLVASDLTGTYTVTLPYGTYALTATASGYLPATSMLAVPTATTHVITITPDIPHIEWQIPPISATLDFGKSVAVQVPFRNTGTQPLTISAAIPPQLWSVADSADDGPVGTLYDMQAFTPLTMTDDLVYTDALDLGFDVPFQATSFRSIYVSSNGWISTKYASNAAPSATCWPNGRLPELSFAPFWADLDPSRGGVVRAGRVMSDTFVVSYEDVPRWDIRPNVEVPTYTFQVALHADGRVQYAYGPMGELPQRWVVGASLDGVAGQNIVCNQRGEMLKGRTFTIEAQANSDLWLAAMPSPLTVQPAATANLTVRVRGLSYVSWRDSPASARIYLSTNDPHQPSLVLRASVLTAPPPYQVWLPQFFMQGTASTEITGTEEDWSSLRLPAPPAKRSDR